MFSACKGLGQLSLWSKKAKLLCVLLMLALNRWIRQSVALRYAWYETPANVTGTLNHTSIISSIEARHRNASEMTISAVILIR